MKQETLVIGFGSTLRGDDAIGAIVAHQFAHEMHGADVEIVHQLTAELALTLLKYKTIVFVDASVNASRVSVAPVSGSHEEHITFFHHMTPASLMAVAEGLATGPAPRAFVVSIPSVSFGFGKPPTPVIQETVHTSVAVLQDQFHVDVAAQ